jgi:hypothetical protein
MDKAHYLYPFPIITKIRKEPKYNKKICLIFARYVRMCETPSKIRVSNSLCAEITAVLVRCLNPGNRRPDLAILEYGNLVSAFREFRIIVILILYVYCYRYDALLWAIWHNFFGYESEVQHWRAEVKKFMCIYALSFR